ncbi:MAG: hypothetical protein EAZ07_00230 [Cytophagales bacterium]|nr:MAG: hypothetical protein EAZ07_00230 [Cytophagales bacterium]
MSIAAKWNNRAFFLKVLIGILLLAISFFPLLINFPYRINIFLTWEGAYRLYLGQIPFKDFGLPMGYAYWIIPAIFFKLFGPYLYSLVIAQCFINLAVGIAFIKILNLFRIHLAIQCVAVLVFGLTYIFLNYWPWYNHTAFVFGLWGLSFLLEIVLSNCSKRVSIGYLLMATFFIFLSFFTKQDYGALFWIFGLILLVYISWLEKTYSILLMYILATAFWSCTFILPLLKYDFGYWFNYGQFPHSARLNYVNFLTRILGESEWEKFYILFVFGLFVNKYQSDKNILTNKKEILFLLFTLGIIVLVLITKVTSVQALGNETFFYGFAVAYLLYALPLQWNWASNKPLIICFFAVTFIFSSYYWKYVTIALKLPPPITFNRIAEKPKPDWKFTNWSGFKKVSLPPSTIKGIDRLMKSHVVQKKDLKVLNMTELTPLALELGYVPLKNQPLWYHMKVGMFDKEAKTFCNNISNGYYDLVLFEGIPAINNFFPAQVQECLKQKYKLVDTFEAPRRLEEGSYVEVYIPKNVEY